MFVLLTALGTAHAQENMIEKLETIAPGQGKVTIKQDARIARLVGTAVVEEGTKTFKAHGYRVQVYAGSNSRESRAEAELMEARVKERFPELKVYTTFNNPSPRWVCRVGDYRTIEEADAVMRQLKKLTLFKEVSIVREQVTITL